MKILAIDPGTTQSGWVLYDPEAHAVKRKGVDQNADLLAKIEDWVQDGATWTLAIEMIASQGMAVGAEVFETVVWIGMFMHAWGYEHVLRVTRNQVKVHVCGSAKAKDANVRQALIDLFPATGGGKTPQVGSTKQPGPLFGMNSHMWPALGVALTAHEKLKDHEAPRTTRQRSAPRRVKLRGL